MVLDRAYQMQDRRHPHSQKNKYTLHGVGSASPIIQSKLGGINTKIRR